MKVIFLDCDGVLNSQVGGFGTPNEDKVERVRNIVKETGAKLVLSSSWRYGKFYNEGSYVKSLYDCLITCLEQYGLELYSSTPIEGKRRGKEIEDWITNCGENIESFIILDDDDDMEPYMDRLVQTDYRIGLQEKDVISAIEKLKGVK